MKQFTLKGTPDGVFHNEELMQLLLPLLRADFVVSETYMYRDELPLSCSLSALGGLQDSEVSRDKLNAWRSQVTGTFALRMLPGDHFFLHRSQPGVLQVVVEDLAPYLR